MGSFLIWNSNSLKPTTEGNNKGNYICRKQKELSNIDVTCLVETHLTDKCEDNSKTSQEQIFPCQSIKVQMKCFFFIPEFERAAKIRKIAVYRFLISFLVPEL